MISQDLRPVVCRRILNSIMPLIRLRRYETAVVVKKKDGCSEGMVTMTCRL